VYNLLGRRQCDRVGAYIIKVARDRGLTKFIRLNREIVAAGFSDGRWHIETASGETDIADVFVCATGFLHRPSFPDIPGRDQFAGPSFHSSRRDHGVPYAGKRWGVIGSGARGVQITEALAWAGCGSPNLSAARNGSISAKTHTRPGTSG
jgi:cation diffusion facilitator CzcD-associated flavoprotein CzcO